MSKRYRQSIQAAKPLFSPGRLTLLAAGHEHGLKLHVDPSWVFHAVSGAGSTSEVDSVRNMRSVPMSIAAPGSVHLDVYGDATLRLNVIALEGEGDAERVFTICILHPDPGLSGAAGLVATAPASRNGKRRLPGELRRILPTEMALAGSSGPFLSQRTARSL